MITRKQKEEREILEYAGVTSMPRVWIKDKSNRIWVSAIIEIRKVDMTTSYAFAYNRYNLTPKYIKVLGTSSGIKEIISIHPVSYLDKAYLPKFNSIEELREQISKLYNVDIKTVNKYSEDVIINLAYNYAIEWQVMKLKQEGSDKYTLNNFMKNEKIFREITEGKI